MDRNLILIILGGVAVVVMGAIFFWKPNQEECSLDISASSISVPSSTIDISIKKISSNHQKMFSKEVTHIKKIVKKKKKADPTIKAVTIDTSGRYWIELIDKDPGNKIIKISNQEIFINGNINGNRFRLIIPKQIINSSDLKLKIVDRKTKQVYKIDASALSEFSSENPNEKYFISVDMSNKSIQTKIKYIDPNRNKALPSVPSTL